MVNTHPIADPFTLMRGVGYTLHDTAQDYASNFIRPYKDRIYPALDLKNLIFTHSAHTLASSWAHHRVSAFDGALLRLDIDGDLSAHILKGDVVISSFGNIGVLFINSFALLPCGYDALSVARDAWFAGNHMDATAIARAQLPFTADLFLAACALDFDLQAEMLAAL